jgi:hypothetical protein
MAPIGALAGAGLRSRVGEERQRLRGAWRPRDVRDEDGGQAGALEGQGTTRERPGEGCDGPGFWERWTTDPLFARPKESSDIRRRELTKGFVKRYGDVPIGQVGDEIVAQWLAGGSRSSSVQGLCSMFNDAASVKAGRLVDHNPFQKLGISRGKGRRDQQPPSEQQVWELVGHAWRLSGPSFAAWLQVAAFTGVAAAGGT